MLYNTLLFITQQLKDDWNVMLMLRTGLWIRLQFCVRTAGGALLYQAYGPNTYNPGGEMNNVLSQRPTICCFSSDSHNYDFIRIKVKHIEQNERSSTFSEQILNDIWDTARAWNPSTKKDW